MTHLSEAILRDTNGMNLVLHDPLIVQNLRSRFDFFILDCAARPCDFATIASLLTASGDTPFLVRPANIDKSTLQGLLNLGVDGLVLPDIYHAAELEKAIAACLYPPEGMRPYRSLLTEDKVALEAVNDQITFVVEVSHPQTVSQLEEIAEVTGINGLLVNPQRLSVAMEKGGNTDDPAVRQTLKTIARVAASYELPYGIEGENVFDLQSDFVVPSRDIDLLMGNVKNNSSLSIEEDDEDDFGPVFLAASRE
jgi:2-keto-3-deoxy-L-rhamnonate aldolase RhmA